MTKRVDAEGYKVPSTMFLADQSLQQWPANTILFGETLSQPSVGSTAQGTPCTFVEYTSPCTTLGTPLPHPEA